MNPPQEVQPDPSHAKGRAFRVGIGLIATSFGIWVLFVVIPFLPVSSEAKAGIAVVGWAISWTLFFIGSILAGNEGYAYLKLFVRKWFQKD